MTEGQCEKERRTAKHTNALLTLLPSHNPHRNADFYRENKKQYFVHENTRDCAQRTQRTQWRLKMHCIGRATTINQLMASYSGACVCFIRLRVWRLDLICAIQSYPIICLRARAHVCVVRCCQRVYWHLNMDGAWIDEKRIIYLYWWTAIASNFQVHLKTVKTVLMVKWWSPIQLDWWEISQNGAKTMRRDETRRQRTTANHRRNFVLHRP